MSRQPSHGRCRLDGFNWNGSDWRLCTCRAAQTSNKRVQDTHRDQLMINNLIVRATARLWRVQKKATLADAVRSRSRASLHFGCKNPLNSCCGGRRRKDLGEWVIDVQCLSAQSVWRSCSRCFPEFGRSCSPIQQCTTRAVSNPTLTQNRTSSTVNAEIADAPTAARAVGLRVE